MPSQIPDSGASPSDPSPELVQTLMIECNCAEDRAISLLGIARNDLARAKRHHDLYKRYVPASAATPSTPTPDPETPNPTDITGSISNSAINTPAYSTSGELDPFESSAIASCPQKTPSSIGSYENDTPSDNDISSPSNYRAEAIGKKKTPRVPKRPPKKNNISAQFSSGVPMLKARDKPSDLAVGKTTDISQVSEWDFVLPRVPSSGTLIPSIGEEAESFSPEAFVGAVQHNASVDHVRYHLNCNDKESVRSSINNEVRGFPPIFYAVASGDVNMLRLFLEFGGNPSAVHEASQIPLLAYAIISSDILQTDTTPMVSILLSYGASTNSIPSQFYSPYNQDPPANLKSRSGDSETSDLPMWCTDRAKMKLIKASNVTQRYFLERATKLKPPSKKRRQIAKLRNAERLLGIPYFLIGQAIATEILTQRLLIHLMMPSKRPLVLCFAGPSGHGKTELARQLGHLLSLDLEVVDCTVVNREIELFGPREPYSGAEKGSPVNNFLADHSGQRCIVFFDEFEKTTREIHQSLLLPFDNGEYRDRRNHDKVDCLNTIWIMATNALDNIILDFCQQNEAVIDGNDDEKGKLVKKLAQQLQDAFLDHFDAPLTGRVSAFVPFLPFSRGEQAVITHKSILELATELRCPIDITNAGQEQLIGDIRLLLRKDASICSILAQAHYHRKLGARSLKAGAQKIEQIVLGAYLDQDEEIQGKGDMRDFLIDVQGGEIVCHIGSKNKP